MRTRCLLLKRPLYHPPVKPTSHQDPAKHSLINSLDKRLPSTLYTTGTAIGPGDSEDEKRADVLMQGDAQ